MHTARAHKTLGFIWMLFLTCSTIKAYCFYSTVMNQTTMIIFIQVVCFLPCIIFLGCCPRKAVAGRKVRPSFSLWFRVVKSSDVGWFPQKAAAAGHQGDSVLRSVWMPGVSRWWGENWREDSWLGPGVFCLNSFWQDFTQDPSLRSFSWPHSPHWFSCPRWLIFFLFSAPTQHGSMDLFYWPFFFGFLSLLIKVPSLKLWAQIIIFPFCVDFPRCWL